MAATNSVYLGAIIGVCVALGVCVAALIIFVIVFCRVKIKDDSNTRKRLINNNAFKDVEQAERPRPVLVEEPEPVIIPPPRPVIMPPPPQRPVLVPSPRIVPVMPPPPQPQPVVIREVIREREPSPQPVRRNVGNRDDWVLVKKVRKRRNDRRAVSDDEYEDSDDDTCHRRSGCHRHRHGHREHQQMRSSYPRLEAYDLATPSVGPIYAGPRPGPPIAAMSAQQYIPIPIMMQPTL